jgi:hypothetical protein
MGHGYSRGCESNSVSDGTNILRVGGEKGQGEALPESAAGLLQLHLAGILAYSCLVVQINDRSWSRP